MRTWRALISERREGERRDGRRAAPSLDRGELGPACEDEDDISVDLGGRQALCAATAPNRSPMGIAATAAGAMSFRPARASAKRLVR